MVQKTARKTGGIDVTIADSEVLYRRLADVVPQLLWSAGPDSTILYYNGRIANYTSDVFDAEEGFNWVKLVHPDDLDNTIKTWEAAVASGNYYSCEHRLRMADGTWRWHLSQALPAIDSDGRIAFWHGTATDIHDLKESQAALAASEARFRFISHIDETTRGLLRPLDIMEASTRLLGEHMNTSRCAYADVEPDNDTFTIRHDYCSESAPSATGVYSLDQFGAFVACAMREGRTLCLRNVALDLDEEIGRATFSAIGIQAIICCPMVKQGKLIAMMAVHQDIPRDWTEEEIRLVEAVSQRSWASIERARSDLRLREGEARFRGTFDNAAVGIAHVGVDGRWLRVNRKLSEIMGYTMAELEAMTFQDITHGEDLESDMAQAQALLRGDIEYYQMEKRYYRKDGGVVWANLTVSAQRDETGKVIYFISIVEDIMKEKALRDQVIRENERKNHFLATMAHELRNPLAPITHAFDLLSREDIGEERRKSLLEIGRSSLDHIVRLVDDLLEITRINRDQIDLDLRPVPVQEVLRSSLQETEPLIEEKNHKLETYGLDRSFVVVGDKSRLRQVFSNLLNNAAKYTPPGGNIRLECDVRPASVQVRLLDDGPGIPEDMLGRVFDLFMQVQRPLERNEGGLGIGLSLVKRLVQLHGGDVRAENRRDGRGCCFTVILPLAEGENAGPDH